MHSSSVYDCSGIGLARVGRYVSAVLHASSASERHTVSIKLKHLPPFTPVSSAANMRSVHIEDSAQLQSFLPFHPQTRWMTPGHRFVRHFSVTDAFQTSPCIRTFVALPPPNRVRYPTDWQFASGCSPPHLTVTQLPLASALWLLLARTCTLLIKRLHRRTGTGSRRNDDGGVSVPPMTTRKTKRGNREKKSTLSKGGLRGEWQDRLFSRRS